MRTGPTYVGTKAGQESKRDGNHAKSGRLAINVTTELKEHSSIYTHMHARGSAYACSSSNTFRRYRSISYFIGGEAPLLKYWGGNRPHTPAAASYVLSLFLFYIPVHSSFISDFFILSLASNFLL